MDNTNYIFIQPWMINLFKPKDSKKGSGVDYIKVLIFAYIFSFSRDGKSKWYGKQQTLAELVGCSEQVLCTKLKELVNEGYIGKEEVQLYGMFHHNNYWVNLESVVVHSEITTVNSELTAMNSGLTNNKSDYNSYNKSIIDTKVESLVPPTYVLEEKEVYIYTGILKHIDNLGLSEPLSVLVKEWVEMLYKSKGIRIGAKQVDRNLGLIGIYPEDIQKQLVSDATFKCHNTFKFVIEDYEKKKSYGKGFKKNTNIPQTISRDEIRSEI